ncbi:hypothetical protein [Pectinatus cerevisiiphilus]|uniref:hypothetical protein n=1 Tax=Pectinatus cerevisiiphilus TaxID=86956 RepID=UPI0014055D46|nr:hypothetical protein [Pectinatus cerevisiiphilus]
MSTPKSPYYYKKDSDTYHWEISCSKNNYSPSNPDWVKTTTRPSSREECDECKAK